MGLPSPAEILHGRNLTTRAQAEIDIKAIRSVLQERQLKMTLDRVGEPRRQGHWWWVKGAMSWDLAINGLTLSLQVSLTVAEAMRHRWRPLGNI